MLLLNFYIIIIINMIQYDIFLSLRFSSLKYSSSRFLILFGPMIFSRFSLTSFYCISKFLINSKCKLFIACDRLCVSMSDLISISCPKYSTSSYVIMDCFATVSFCLACSSSALAGCSSLLIEGLSSCRKLCLPVLFSSFLLGTDDLVLFPACAI